MDLRPDKSGRSLSPGPRTPIMGRTRRSADSMPEATRDIHDSQDLGGQVDALLGELQSAPAPAVEHVNGTATPALNGTPNGAAPVADVAANGVAAASEHDSALPPSLPPPPAPPAPLPPAPMPEATSQPAAGPAAQAAAPAASESDEDLAKAVEKLLEEVPENQPLPTPAAPAASGQPPEKIESLDAELA